MSIELQYHSDLREPRSLGLGVFDGVHRGHQALVDRCESVLTFNPHPAVVVKGVKDLKRLTTIDEMTAYIPNLISLTFTSEIAQLSANAFLDEIILKRIKAKKLVIGYDYFFGRDRKGTPDMLREWGMQHGINVEVVSPVQEADTIFKSKAIREALVSGDVQAGLSWLGHSYLMKGRVIRGDGRGSSLGFPTANMQFSENKLIPQTGVYKGSVAIQDRLYRAAIYCGDRPTFKTQLHAVEVFVLDFEGDLYGQELAVYVESFLRREMVFDSPEALIEQIQSDVEGV